MGTEDSLTPNQKRRLAELREAKGSPVVLPASTGATLVELGFAKPAPRIGETRVPFGYGTFALNE